MKDESEVRELYTWRYDPRSPDDSIGCLCLTHGGIEQSDDTGYFATEVISKILECNQIESLGREQSSDRAPV
jgi:hypothetical protein